MSKKITTDDFKKMVLENSRNDGADFEVIGEYLSTKEKIEMLYKPLNKKFLITPNHFLTGRRPPFYPNKRGKVRKNEERNTEWFKNKVKELVGDEFTVIGEYRGYNTRIEIQHNSEICNYRKFTMTPAQFIGSPNRPGHRCEICSGHTPDSSAILKKLNTKFEDSGFKFLEVDIANDKVKIEHTVCKNIFIRSRRYIQTSGYISPDSLICPYCNAKSKANNAISKLLLEKNIKFIPEATFPGLSNLRFDFKIFINNEIFFLLELDGIQHRERVEYFDSKTSFEKRKERDMLKDNFAEKSGVKLYRMEIPRVVTNNVIKNIKNQVKEILDHYKLL